MANPNDDSDFWYQTTSPCVASGSMRSSRVSIGGEKGPVEHDAGPISDRRKRNLVAGIFARRELDPEPVDNIFLREQKAIGSKRSPSPRIGRGHRDDLPDGQRVLHRSHPEILRGIIRGEHRPG